MLRLLAALAGLTFLLTGCVLEADPPLFAESQGVLALGDGPVAFDGYTLKNGVWTKSNTEDPPLQFTPQDRHYVVRELGKTEAQSNKATALFAPLGDNWMALQLTEEGKPAVYSLTRLEGRNLLVTPLMCSDLKKDDEAARHVAFAGQDCTARDVSDPEAFFARLAKNQPSPELKLVPVQ